jgi:hypothetical protein
MGLIHRFVVRRHRQRALALENERLRACLQNADTAEAQSNDAEQLGPDGLPKTGLADTRFVVGRRIEPPSELIVVDRHFVVACHQVLFGATGAGKTVEKLNEVDQELRRMIRRIDLGLPPDTAIIFLEPKHDMAPTALRLIEYRLRAATAEVRERILSKLTTFNPSGRYVVPFPLLRPEQGVSPELHATSLSGLIGRLSGSPFGPKQRPILDVLLLAFILAGSTLPEAVEMLGNWERLRAFGLRSTSPLVRGFFEENVRGIPAAVMDGIRARLLRLVFQPNLRAMFSATEGMDFDDMLRAGRISVLDVGGGLGDEDLTDFFCGLFILKLGRAMRRRPNAASAVILIIDEFPRVLQGDGDVAERVAGLLEQARSRSVAVHMLCQGAESVSAASPRLLHAVHTNCAVEILGATNDARALSDILPVTGRRLRPPPMPWESPPASPWLSREEELRMLVEQTQALPPRHFWVWRKRSSAKAVLVKTLDFVVPESHGDALTDRIERGRWGRLPDEILPAKSRPRVVILGNSPGPSRRPRGL